MKEGRDCHMAQRRRVIAVQGYLLYFITRIPFHSIIHSSVACDAIIRGSIGVWFVCDI